MAKLEVLVVEDKQHHIADAQAFFATKADEVTVTYASTLQQAEEALAAKRFDGVITDVFFPTGYTDSRKQEKADGLMSLVAEGYQRQFDPSFVRSPIYRKNAVETALRDFDSTDPKRFTSGWVTPNSFLLAKIQLGGLRLDSDLEDELKEKSIEEVKQYFSGMVEKYTDQIADYEKWHSGDGTPPNGVLLALDAQRSGIKVVACTDSYHHAALLEPVCNLFRSRDISKNIPMIDGSLSEDGFSGNKKHWEIAYDEIKK